ncbi:MAG: hypothetical protein JEZ12_26920 [Desulfobacterium sp.]|nr:hypothetical protein [Desulfobacterium sp.]
MAENKIIIGADILYDGKTKSTRKSIAVQGNRIVEVSSKKYRPAVSGIVTPAGKWEYYGWTGKGYSKFCPKPSDSGYQNGNRIQSPCSHCLERGKAVFELSDHGNEQQLALIQRGNQRKGTCSQGR